MMHDAVITSATSGMGSIILTSSGSPKQRGHHRITVYMYITREQCLADWTPSVSELV